MDNMTPAISDEPTFGYTEKIWHYMTRRGTGVRRVRSTHQNHCLHSPDLSVIQRPSGNFQLFRRFAPGRAAGGKIKRNALIRYR